MYESGLGRRERDSQRPGVRTIGTLLKGRLTFHPSVTPLEMRLTPSGMIAITDVAVVDEQHQPLDTVSAGQKVEIQVDLTARDVLAHTRYRINDTVNGMTRTTGDLSRNDAQAKRSSWSLDSDAFIASPGVNQVTVALGPNRAVAETRGRGETRHLVFSGTMPAVEPLSYSASQIRAAYGINQIRSFRGAPADGAGQTIAIVDEYNDPYILSDLNGFDKAMHVTTNASPTFYQRYGPSSSILTVYNQYGKNITRDIAESGNQKKGVPTVPPSDGFNWQSEETIDVESAHAIAPGAKIDLIECSGTGSDGGLFTGANTARTLPRVSVVSMSWGFSEGSENGAIGQSEEDALNSSTFVTPKHHRNVTFVACTLDAGVPSGYPSKSPNVVAVGATQLTLISNSYAGETGWSFPAPSTVDYGSTHYSQTGDDWTSHSGGFTGSYSTADRRTNSSATWTTPITAAELGWQDESEVSATWVASPGNATDATYEIFDGPADPQNLLNIVTVNQTIAPVGTSEGNTMFQDLGSYDIRSGTLTVVLNVRYSNGTVVADTVGVAPALATGGGRSIYQPAPAYQLPFQNTEFRTTPDVSFNGSSNSGETLYQNGELSFDYWGTSVAAPCWAGLFAIADQGRMARGGKAFNSPADPTQALQAIYSLPATDFYDITSGYNGFTAGPGYDQVTGRGSPIANRLVPALAGYGLRTPRA